MRIRLGGLLIAATLIFGVNSAQAAFITFTDQTAWETAVAGLGLGVVVEDFTDTTLVSGLTTANGTISGGVFNGTALTQFNDAGNPRLQLSPGTQAIGGSWDLSPGGAGDGLVFIINGTVQASVQPGTFTGFLGFVSTDATLITSLRLDSPGTGQETFSLDNLRIASGTATPVPEPATLALFSLSLGGATYRAARRRRSQ